APRRRLHAHEVEHGIAETLPGRLVLEEDVVPRVQLHEPGPGYLGGEPATLGDRGDAVVPGVDDEGRRAHPAEQVGDVDAGPGLQQLGRDPRRGRLAAELVEPVHLLVRRPRDEARGEYLAERGVVLAPAETSQLDDRAVLPLGVGIAAAGQAAGVAAVEQQARDALRVPDRVGDARRG